MVLWTPRAASAAEFLTGQLLVAGANLVDPSFSRTVIFVVRHDADGAQGLVINRPMGKVPLNRLLQSLDHVGSGGESSPPPGQGGAASNDASLPVFYGGPVESFLAFTLHSRDVMPEHSVPIDNDTALNVEDDALKALAKGAGPHHVLFLLGYAGWGPGQLESELQRGDWCIVKADPDLVFSEEPGRTWQRAWAHCGTEL